MMRHPPRFVATYHEIAANERLVYVYDMHVDGVLISVSLATATCPAHHAWAASALIRLAISPSSGL